MPPTVRPRRLYRVLAVAAAAVLSWACVPPSEGRAELSASGLSSTGRTCWEKRAYYQARNRGLKETLGSGTAYSSPCVLAAYVAIEQAAAEFGVTGHINTMIRIAACESLLQPTMVGIADPTDVGLFQWNEKPPHHWWSTIRAAFNTWQHTRAAMSDGRYIAQPATANRLDPYNAARVAAWVIATHPRSWPVVWHCKGIYDPARGRLR